MPCVLIMTLYCLQFLKQDVLMHIMRSAVQTFCCLFNHWTRLIIAPQQTVCFLPCEDLDRNCYNNSKPDLLSKPTLAAEEEREKVLSSYFDQIWKIFDMLY